MYITIYNNNINYCFYKDFIELFNNNNKSYVSKTFLAYLVVAESIIIDQPLDIIFLKNIIIYIFAIFIELALLSSRCSIVVEHVSFTLMIKNNIKKSMIFH